MNDHKTRCCQSAQSLRAFAGRISSSPVMIGFDGFVDSIIAVVDQRHDVERYDSIPTIDRFAKKIAAAAGKSSNYELVVKLEKLGGNGPIFANAMATTGTPVTYIGGVGYPDVHHVFADFAARCDQCLSIAEPGYTDALEFDDGKLMLGKHSELKNINADRLREVVGDDQLKRIISRCHLIGMVNWTMLTAASDIWRYLIADILPGLKWDCGERGRIFIDLTDPEKRTADDLSDALQLITQMQRFADVTLGLNLKESTQVAAVLGINPSDDAESVIESTAAAIREKLDIYTVLIHPLKSAAGARKQGDGQVVTAFVESPYTKKPKLSTGAGDNFNAGCCLGWLADLPLDQMLVVGNATAGYYVRNGGSPNFDQLVEFVETMPRPE